MARDYAKTRSSGNNSKKKKNNRRPTPAAKRKQKQTAGLGIPGWVWLFCGLCIGLVIAAVVYLTRPAGQPGIQVNDIQPQTEAPPADSQQTADSSDAKKKKKETKQEPRFEFYEMLPNYEVVIPGHRQQDTNVAAQDSGDSSGAEPQPEPKPTPQYEASGPYIVQVGSFSAYQRADRLRARIALLGIASEIHKAELSDGRVFYRVRTTLIEGPDTLNHILEKLHNNGIRTLVMRRSG